MWLAVRGELPEPLHRLAGYRPTVPEYGKLKTEVPEACVLANSATRSSVTIRGERRISPLRRMSTSTTPSSTTTAYAFTYPMGISITPSTISRMS